MYSTYPATLKGQKLTWGGKRRPRLAPEREIAVHVTLLEEVFEEDEQAQGREVAALFSRLAALSERNLPTDAATWEREIRIDRPLPGRNE